MKHKLAILLLLFTLGGCILNPIYHKKDLIDLDELIGNWELSNKSDEIISHRWEITKIRSKEYQVKTYQTQVQHLAKFLKLKGDIYGDMVNSDHGIIEDTYHNVTKLQIENDEMTVKMLDLDYLIDGLKSKKYTLPYRIEKDNSSDYNTGDHEMITASTDELQEFLINHRKDENLFSEKGKMVFKKIPESFCNYFPKEAWEFKEIERDLSFSKAIEREKNGSLKFVDISLFADEFMNSELKYKPFYFGLIESALWYDPENTALKKLCSSFVLDHTIEFVHYFNGSSIRKRHMQFWANQLSAQYPSETELSNTLEAIQANCKQCCDHELGILNQFIDRVKKKRF